MGYGSRRETAFCETETDYSQIVGKREVRGSDRERLLGVHSVSIPMISTATDKRDGINDHSNHESKIEPR